MKKVMTIFGTRPEAIKLCPLIKWIERNSTSFRPLVCVTGQHREMLDQVLKVFAIVPDYDLNLMTRDQTLFQAASRILVETGRIIGEAKPDIVLVQGDTTTTFAASMAAYYSQVKVGHVEAGLRTGNKYSPFPEELNRKLTSVVADVHFAPTLTSRGNLLKEGVPDSRIIVTGNTVIDALLWVKDKIQSDHREYKELDGIDFGKTIILVTGHRRENFGQDFVSICEGIKTIALSNANVQVVYPVHFNPNVRRCAYSVLSGIKNVKLIEPLDYEPFVYLMMNCHFIISDSGGVQEEAPSLGKPVLVTRNTTERPEAVEAGTVKLVGTEKDRLIAESQKLLSDVNHYRAISTIQNPYGDGHACERIVESLSHFRF